MTTRTIKRKHDEGPLAGDFQAPPETAPSLVRADQPTAARAIASISLLATSIGAFALVLAAFGRATLVGPAGGVFFLALGLGGLLYHAAREKDVQYRRIYGVLGAALLAGGILFRLLPVEGQVGGLFLPAGVPSLALALFFLLAFVRNEDDVFLRFLTVRAFGVVAALLILVGLVGGLMREEFFLGQGVVMLVLGLVYAAGYVAAQPAGSERGYWAGLGLGAAGAVMVLIAVGRLLLPGLFEFVNWSPGQPGPPFLFFYLGLEFLLLSAGICSDAKLVAMTRRELAAYFYSPIAYIVLIAIALIGWVAFFNFVNYLALYTAGSQFGMPEPIVREFVWHVVPVFAVVCAVPILTMRLLSEEQRSGTLEVLLTAPVNEWSVVLSKFFAALRFFLLIWYSWGIYLIALRVGSGEEFDYRPLLSFAIVLLVTGAHFVSLGVFCSGVTRNQIAAAILSVLGMLILLGFGIFNQLAPEGSAWRTVLVYVSFLDLWHESLQGNLAPRFLVFHVSATVFWLFLTVKVLEARKWR